MRLGSGLRWLEAALLLGAAVVAWRFHLTLPGKLPSDADDQAAAAVLAKESLPGDAVLLFPWWTERARLFTPPGLPVVGYLGSEKDDLEDHPRVWVLSQPKLPRADAKSFDKAFLPNRTVAGGYPRSFGPLELALYRNGRYRPAIASSNDAAPKAGTVTVEGPNGERTPCLTDGSRVRCPGSGFVTGPEWHELFYRPRRCLWVHPPGGATLLGIDLPRPAEARSVAIEAGLIWEHAAKKDPGLTPVEIRLEGASSPGRIDLLPGKEGLIRVERPLSADKSSPLRVTLRSANPESREVCLAWRVDR